MKNILFAGISAEHFVIVISALDLYVRKCRENIWFVFVKESIRTFSTTYQIIPLLIKCPQYLLNNINSPPPTINFKQRIRNVLAKFYDVQLIKRNEEINVAISGHKWLNEVTSKNFKRSVNYYGFL